MQFAIKFKLVAKELNTTCMSLADEIFHIHCTGKPDDFLFNSTDIQVYTIY